MLYRDKIDWIIPFVQGKKVLDLGCVRHNLEETEKDEWLHGLICEKASSVLGVDYLEDEVKELKSRGYNVVCENVESMKLEEKFELVVAGDLIEHLNNFGLFLANVKEHMLEDGKAIMTTPNPVCPIRFFNVLLKGEPGANDEHTCWFTEKVLYQLFDRYDLEICQVDYVDDTYQYYDKSNFKWWPFLAINWLLARVRNQFSETICIVIRHKNQT